MICGNVFEIHLLRKNMIHVWAPTSVHKPKHYINVKKNIQKAYLFPAISTAIGTIAVYSIVV